MDKRVLRERMRRKKRQMMIRHYTKIGLCVIGMILAVVFVVRGIIIPIAHHVAGGGSSDQTVQAQADTEEVQANSDAAVRQPLKGKSDTDKVAAMTAGWHEDANGKWYQNTDGTYLKLVGTLSDIAAKVKEVDFPSPAIIVVGEVASLELTD